MNRTSIVSVRARVAAILCAFLAFAIVPEAAAFEVRPVVQDLQPGRSAAIRLINPGVSDLTIEVRVAERSVAVDGTESHSDADADFIVFPAQAVVPAESEQTFRVQWAGTEELTASRSYHVFFEQVLADLGDDAGALVRTQFVLGASLHVVPPGTDPDVTVERIAPASDAGSHGDDGLVVTLRNDGARYAYLDEVDVAVSANGREHLIPADQIAMHAGRTLLPPTAVRTIALPWPSDLPREGPIEAVARIR